MHQTTPDIDYRTPHPVPRTQPPTCRIPRPGVATPQIRIRQFATVCDRVIFSHPTPIS